MSTNKTLEEAAKPTTFLEVLEENLSISSTIEPNDEDVYLNMNRTELLIETYNSLISIYKNGSWRKSAASYRSQNSVSKEHYDELKLNYDILVEENKRLNERERELVECLEWILVSDVWQHMRGRAIGNKVEAALSTHKP